MKKLLQYVFIFLFLALFNEQILLAGKKGFDTDSEADTNSLYGSARDDESVLSSAQGYVSDEHFHLTVQKKKKKESGRPTKKLKIDMKKGKKKRERLLSDALYVEKLLNNDYKAKVETLKEIDKKVAITNEKLKTLKENYKEDLDTNVRKIVLQLPDTSKFREKMENKEEGFIRNCRLLAEYAARNNWQLESSMFAGSYLNDVAALFPNSNYLKETVGPVIGLGVLSGLFLNAIEKEKDPKNQQALEAQYYAFLEKFEPSTHFIQSPFKALAYSLFALSSFYAAGYSLSLDRVCDCVALFLEKVCDESEQNQISKQKQSFHKRYKFYFEKAWRESGEFQHQGWYKTKWARILRGSLGALIVGIMLYYSTNSNIPVGALPETIHLSFLRELPGPDAENKS